MCAIIGLTGAIYDRKKVRKNNIMLQDKKVERSGMVNTGSN